MTIAIRTMKRDDWEQVRAIYEAGIETGKATFETKVPEEYDNWLKQTNPACCLVAVQEQTIIGWSKASPVSERRVYAGVGEVSVYVKAEARGIGIGARLLRDLINVTEENGFWTLQASVFPENEASLHLHKKNGFREIGRRERIAQLNGIWRDTVLLERRSNKVGLG
ncbi:GNAT family N-acetyltransferase [Halalkalibacter oceani]|uniref:GNAT family N-acetyltransferase n=1 Tax=Halalkalibacter oceani TaxID=1653776 RepID=UPI00339A4D0F